MAYTSDITAVSVVNGGDIATITINVIINDDATPVLDFNVAAKYNKNSPDMNAVRTDLQNQIKDVFDEYVYAQGVLNGTALATMIGNIDTALETYMNS